MSDLPLLDAIEQADALRAGQLRAESAASHAERVEPNWKDSALEAVRLYAEHNPRFLAYQVQVPVPSGVTRRALGAIMPAAARRGWIVADGYELDEWGSAKTAWKSLIYGGAA